MLARKPPGAQNGDAAQPRPGGPTRTPRPDSGGCWHQDLFCIVLNSFIEIPLAYQVCVCVYMSVCVCVQLLSYVRLCDPMDCSPPGSSVYGIFQARILEWVAISFCRGSSQPRDQTRISVSPALAGGFFTIVPPGKPVTYRICPLLKSVKLNGF